jgi:hypothetical protein
MAAATPTTRKNCQACPKMTRPVAARMSRAKVSVSRSAMRMGEGGAVHLPQQVALQPLTDLARRDDHGQAREEHEEAVALGQVAHADLVEIEVPLHKAEEVVDAGEGQDGRQQPPLELAQALGHAREVAVGAEPHEDAGPQQQGEEEPAAQLLDVHHAYHITERAGSVTRDLDQGQRGIATASHSG